MKMTERYTVQALAASISTFSELSFKAWKEQAQNFHISFDLSDEALRLGYVVWLQRRREERK